MSTRKKATTFLPLVAVVVTLMFSVGLAACESVDDEVKQGVEKVEQQIVTEAKKLAWNAVNDELNTLKESLLNDEDKGVDWARDEVAEVRDGLKKALDAAESGGARGLDWIDEELQKLEEKLAGYENADQVIEAIDEFIKDLKTRLEIPGD